MDGKTAMFPGDFGDPSEDCNCRCIALTRARWALDEDELKVMQERAEFFGLDKTESFKEYKEKFLTVSEYESGKVTYKDTVISPMVKTAEYRRKFDEIGEEKEVTRKMWSAATNMLSHRSGTKYEDMAFIDSKTGKALFQTGYNAESAVEPTKAMKKMVTSSEPFTIISIHNHPGSSVPSIQDIITAHDRQYKFGLVACHNGTVFKYSVANDFNIAECDFRLTRLQAELIKGEVDAEKVDNIIKKLYNIGVKVEVI